MKKYVVLLKYYKQYNYFELLYWYKINIIFSYFCLRVSRHNTGFEFPEDCKNMSFSELFDQELFSSQGKTIINYFINVLLI